MKCCVWFSCHIYVLRLAACGMFLFTAIQQTRIEMRNLDKIGWAARAHTHAHRRSSHPVSPLLSRELENAEPFLDEHRPRPSIDKRIGDGEQQRQTFIIQTPDVEYLYRLHALVRIRCSLSFVFAFVLYQRPQLTVWMCVCAVRPSHRSIVARKNLKWINVNECVDEWMNEWMHTRTVLRHFVPSWLRLLFSSVQHRVDMVHQRYCAMERRRRRRR